VTDGQTDSRDVKVMPRILYMIDKILSVHLWNQLPGDVILKTSANEAKARKEAKQSLKKVSVNQSIKQTNKPCYR
jgi:hypothetical protein